MKPIFVRRARLEDRDLVVKWMVETPHNEADASVFGYKSTTFRCAYSQDKIIAFMPLQRPLMLESLAKNPEATPIEMAAALRSLIQDVLRSAEEEGAGELYFLGSEASLPEFAKKHGFEEVPFKVFRIRVKDFEPKCQPQKNEEPNTKV